MALIEVLQILGVTINCMIFFTFIKRRIGQIVFRGLNREPKK